MTLLDDYLKSGRDYLRIFKGNQTTSQNAELYNVLCNKLQYQEHFKNIQSLSRLVFVLCSAQIDKIFVENTNKQENCRLIQQMIQPMKFDQNPVEEKLKAYIVALKKEATEEMNLLQCEIIALIGEDYGFLTVLRTLHETKNFEESKLPRIILELLKIIPKSKFNLLIENPFRLNKYASQALESIEESEEEQNKKQNKLNQFRQNLKCEMFIKNNLREPYGFALQQLIKYSDSEPINEGLLMAKLLDTSLFSPFKHGLEGDDSYIIMYLNIIFLLTNLTCEHRAGKKVTQVELNEWQRTGHIADSLFGKFQRPLLLESRAKRPFEQRGWPHHTVAPPQ